MRLLLLFFIFSAIFSNSVFAQSNALDSIPSDTLKISEKNEAEIIFPNPFEDQLTIVCQEADIEIVSLVGKKIYTGKVKKRLIIKTTDSKCQRGLYFIVIYMPSKKGIVVPKVVTRKIIKK